MPAQVRLSFAGTEDLGPPYAFDLLGSIDVTVTNDAGQVIHELSVYHDDFDDGSIEDNWSTTWTGIDQARTAGGFDFYRSYSPRPLGLFRTVHRRRRRDREGVLRAEFRNVIAVDADTDAP